MPLAIEKVEADALMLGRNDRAKVALHLLDSLEPVDLEHSPDSIEKAWLAESAKRLAAYHSGKMEAYSVESVIEELEASDT